MILCCGEALIDMIQNEEGSVFVPCPGGAVFSTAIGLGRQGADVGLLSGISYDLFGEQLLSALSESQVKMDYLIRSNRPTTLAFVKIVDGKTNYAFYDEHTAGRMLSPEVMPKQLSAQIEALFFGGISLAVEPCAEAYVSFLKRNAEDHFIMVDPNIRPSFIVDEKRYRQRLNETLSHADIVKISDEDLEWIDGSENSLEEKAQTILDKGPSLVCLTLGSNGVQVFNHEGLLVSLMSPVVDVIDTVGAGDAFNAGFLTCLSRTNNLSKSAIKTIKLEHLQHCIDFATAFASDTVTRQGSDPAWNFEAAVVAT